MIESMGIGELAIRPGFTIPCKRCELRTMGPGIEPAPFRVPKYGQLFLGVVLAQVVFVLSVNIYYLVDSVGDTLTQYYTILTIVTSLFTLFFAWKAILEENVYELLAFAVCSLLLALRTIYTYIEHRDGQANVAVMSVCILLEVAYLPLGWSAYKQFGYRLYKTLHTADLQIISMYNRYLQFKSLVVVDLQFAVSLLLVVIFFCEVDSKAAVIVGASVNLLVYIVGFVGIRQERRWLIYIFTALIIVEPSYIIFKIIRIWEDPFASFRGIDQHDIYRTQIIVTTTIIFALLTRALLFIVLYVCFMNFGKGLKVHAFGSDNEKRQNANMYSTNSSTPQRSYGTAEAVATSGRPLEQHLLA